MNVKKPIAVLTHHIPVGFDWTLSRLQDNVAEYSTNTRVITDVNGQKYVVICAADQLRGWEISDFWIAPGFGKNEDAERIRLTAQQRMR